MKSINTSDDRMITALGARCPLHAHVPDELCEFYKHRLLLSGIEGCSYEDGLCVVLSGLFPSLNGCQDNN